MNPSITWWGQWEEEGGKFPSVGYWQAVLAREKVKAGIPWIQSVFKGVRSLDQLSKGL